VVAGGGATGRFFFQRARLDRVRQLHHEGDVDVSGEQRPLDLLDDPLDVVLVEPRLP
jgi:hypothetical protein